MHRTVHITTRSLRALVFAFAVSLFALLASAPVTHAMTLSEVLDQAEADLNEIAMLLDAHMTGEVLGASTAKPVPVRPVCRLSTDKKAYKVGESIKVTWSTSGTEYVTFVPTTDGKDAYYVGKDREVPSGSVQIPATYASVPGIAIRATSPTGHTVMCTKYISISDPSTGTNPKVLKLDAELAALVSKINKLNEQREKIAAQILDASVRIRMIEIEKQELDNDTVAQPEKPIIRVAETKVSDIVHPDDSSKNTGEFEITFDVTAADTDMYIPKTASRGPQLTGVNFRTTTADGVVASGTVVATLSSTAATKDTYFVVAEGEVETFTLKVVFDPRTSGFYKVGMVRVNWNDTAAAPDAKLSAQPAEDFITDVLSI